MDRRIFVGVLSVGNALGEKISGVVPWGIYGGPCSRESIHVIKA